MTAEAIADQAGDLDIHLTPDAEHIDTPAMLPDEVEKTIISARTEVLFWLAEREHAQVLERLNELPQRIDDQSVPLRDREILVKTDLDENLDRLSTLRRVIEAYEKSGAASWYRQGWVMVKSELLGGQIVVIVKDGNIIDKLPAGARRFSIYELQEVESLGTADERIIRATHAAKRVFCGNIEVTAS